MKVDLAVGSPSPREAATLARAAEDAGFDGVWVAETQHDPFLSAALMLAATTRLEVGTSVAIAFARSPIVLAQTAFDLAALGSCRFHLGLGTQVRGHIERRFGMSWSAAAPRLEEWIGAIDAVWSTWQHGAPFRYRSEHLDLSLMPPFFSPPPLPFASAESADSAARPVPLGIAGVGPGLSRLAGRVADAFHVHPLHTARYLAEMIEPALATGEQERRAESGRRAERIVPVFVADADDAEGVAAVRRQVSFYAATPTYRGVLALHDRARTGERLGRLAVSGRWDEMPALIDDELLGIVAVIAPAVSLPDALVRRVAGHADRVMPLLPFDAATYETGIWPRLISALRSA